MLEKQIFESQSQVFMCLCTKKSQNIRLIFIFWIPNSQAILKTSVELQSWWWCLWNDIFTLHIIWSTANTKTFVVTECSTDTPDCLLHRTTWQGAVTTSTNQPIRLTVGKRYRVSWVIKLLLKPVERRAKTWPSEKSFSFVLCPSFN